MRKLTLLVVLTALLVPVTANAKPNWKRLDKDIHPAIAYSAKTWKVSASWLHSCIHTEGGHGRFIVSDSGYEDSGWFQFLPSTFRRMSAQAWPAGYGLGPHKTPPTRYKRIDSRLGQAWTAAWAFAHGLSREWFGSGC